MSTWVPEVLQRLWLLLLHRGAGQRLGFIWLCSWLILLDAAFSHPAVDGPVAWQAACLTVSILC